MVFTLAVYAVFCLHLLITALYDLLFLRIPNKLVLSLVGFFFLAYGLDYFFYEKNIFQPLSQHLICAGVALIITFIIYSLGVFGGGDAKIIPAIILWIGFNHILTFITFTTVFGFFLAIIGLIFKKTKSGQKTLQLLAKKPLFSQGWFKSLANNKNVLPYGIAIAFGGAYSFYIIIQGSLATL